MSKLQTNFQQTLVRKGHFQEDEEVESEEENEGGKDNETNGNTQGSKEMIIRLCFSQHNTAMVHVHHLGPEQASVQPSEAQQGGRQTGWTMCSNIRGSPGSSWAEMLPDFMNNVESLQKGGASANVQPAKNW